MPIKATVTAQKSDGTKTLYNKEKKFLIMVLKVTCILYFLKEVIIQTLISWEIIFNVINKLRSRGFKTPIV
jgi:hypothetical protein